jgi:uncharacterized membrane protein YphA (DoxX/SURF4 family)
MVGGLLLRMGVLTRPVAFVLARDTIGAIVGSGIARAGGAKGELVRLTLAPAELVVMLCCCGADLVAAPCGRAAR